jgi:L-asparaginase
MAGPDISLVIAGGELVMKASGTTTSVQKEADEPRIRAWLPEELSARVKIVDWSHQPSSHYSVRMTADLIDLLSKQVSGGASAVVVFCGSDAVEEMAYLADLLWIYPQPLIFAATLTPPGETEGGEAVTILREALAAAAARETWGQGVLVCSGGELFAASDAVEVANYGRCGFDGTFRGAVGSVVEGHVVLWQAPRRSRIFDAPFTPARNVELLYASLGGGERFLQMLTENPHSIDGLVLAGFGSGNVYPAWVAHIKALVRENVPVVVVSRCARGCVLDKHSFEGSFSKLSELGVMSGGLLTPEQARLKLAVGLGAGLKDQELQNYLLDR